MRRIGSFQLPAPSFPLRVAPGSLDARRPLPSRRCDSARRSRNLRAGSWELAAGSYEMKILIADKFEQSGIDGLAAAGCEVVSNPDLKDEALREAIAATRADVLVVRSTRVTAPMLDAGRLS